MTQNVIKWLNELCKLLKSIEGSSSPDENSDQLMSSDFHKVETLLLEGERDNIIEALARTLFAPWTDKQKSVNQVYFHQEGGLDVLMEVYGMLVGKEWGNFIIDEEIHMDLEDTCCTAICNYAQTFHFIASSSSWEV